MPVRERRLEQVNQYINGIDKNSLEAQQKEKEFQRFDKYVNGNSPSNIQKRDVHITYNNSVDRQIQLLEGKYGVEPTKQIFSIMRNSPEIALYDNNGNIREFGNIIRDAETIWKQKAHISFS